MHEALLLTLLLAVQSPPDLAMVREHVAKGRWEEATESLQTLTEKHPQDPEVALWRGRVLVQTGQPDAALTLWQEFLTKEPSSVSLLAEQAAVLFDQGRVKEAGQAAEKVLASHPDHPRARLIQCHVWTATGEIEKATEGYRWFVRYYNRVQPEDAETLLIIGQGAAQYARWKSVSQIFDFLVNTVCPDVLKADPNCWEAHLLAGQLLLEKYNRAEGLPELQQALTINPSAAEVQLALAEGEIDQQQYEAAMERVKKVLALNASHPTALRLQAQIQLLQGHLEAADRLLKPLREKRPYDQSVQALSAYLETLRGNDIPADQVVKLLATTVTTETPPGASPLEQMIRDLLRINPRPGYFLLELGQMFEGQRKFRHAEACYQQALQLMPQLGQPRSELGMLYFQEGRLADAQKLLDEAFKADPYHVRISNMRKVLKVLDGYATESTPHFVIRYDSQLDGVLARYVAEELEQVYTQVTEEFGFEPPQRTPIEIYNNARGLGGHQWFSARMVGLPWLQTIGASTGLIIALTSPGATEEPYNWARVVRHEFVHIVTLQQTDFNIPHWFTEALATRAEGYPFPKGWNALLVKRVTTGQLRNLDNLHLGFQRAESREDWDFAYCQSVLYAEYFVKRFGKDALSRLLAAYRTTRSTDVALQTAFETNKEDIEAGYLLFLKERVQELQSTVVDTEPDPEELKARYEADPNSAGNQAAYAQILLRERKWDQAEKLARAALQQDSHHALAAIVLAQLQIRADNFAEALQTLTAAFDAEHPDRRLWRMRGQLLLREQSWKPAVDLFQQGVAVFPDDVDFWRGLAEAADGAQSLPELKRALDEIAKRDADSADAPLKRAQLALDERDYETAVAAAHRALQVDVLDADIHLALARGYAGQKSFVQAAAEYDVALQLKPGDKVITAERAALPVPKGP